MCVVVMALLCGLYDILGDCYMDFQSKGPLYSKKMIYLHSIFGFFSRKTRTSIWHWVLLNRPLNWLLYRSPHPTALTTVTATTKDARDREIRVIESMALGVWFTFSSDYSLVDYMDVINWREKNKKQEQRERRLYVFTVSAWHNLFNLEYTKVIVSL